MILQELKEVSSVGHKCNKMQTSTLTFAHFLRQCPQTPILGMGYRNQLSLASPLWVGAISGPTSDGYGHR